MKPTPEIIDNPTKRPSFTLLDRESSACIDLTVKNNFY